MKKGRSKLLMVLGIIAAVIILMLAGGFFAVTRGLSEMQDLVINDVNPAEVPDGSYTGEFSRYRWSNTVKVTVEGGRIVDIEPDSDEALVQEELSERIIARQSLMVDIDSGATVSSKAFLKAVGKALSP